MSTIIITPLGVTEEDTSEVVQLELVVSDEDFVGLFDRLEVWRSSTDEAGPYEELTAASFQKARIPKTAGDPPSPAVTGPSVYILGTELDLKINEETDLTVTISTGSDPLTYTQVASDINLQGTTLVSSYVDSEGVLVVQTIASGVGASLRVVGGDAAAILGLPTTEPDSIAYGKNARITLVQGQEAYSFTDPFSSSEYYYKTRFRNSLSGAVSSFSLPFSVGQAVGVSQDNIACGALELVGVDGRPLQDLEVRVFTEFNGSLVDSKVVAGGDLIKKTDDTGKVEFNLVRGQTVTVAVMGTDMVREITVPTDTAVKTFNLMDPSVATGEDVFKVQVPDIVVAERRTL